MGSSSIAQGGQVSALWWPRGVGQGGWEGGSRGRGYGNMCMHIADSLWCTTETNSIVKQLYSNKDLLNKQKKNLV